MRDIVIGLSVVAGLAAIVANVFYAGMLFKKKQYAISVFHTFMGVQIFFFAARVLLTASSQIVDSFLMYSQLVVNLVAVIYFIAVAIRAAKNNNTPKGA